MAKPRKQRVEFRKNRSTRRRDGDRLRVLSVDKSKGKPVGPR